MGYNRKALFTCRRRVRYGDGAVRGPCGAAPPRVGGAATATRLAHALISSTTYPICITASHHILTTCELEILHSTIRKELVS
eukprot:1348044-Pleurochrysis_carterae.AAC.1